MDNALDLHIKITWDLWYMGFVDNRMILESN